MIARELGIGTILVPREASILCAAGMLRTDLRHDLVRSYATPFTARDLDSGVLLRLLRDMEGEAQALLRAEGVADEDQAFVYALDLRYIGQYHEVRVDEIRKPRSNPSIWTPSRPCSIAATTACSATIWPRRRRRWNW